MGLREEIQNLIASERQKLEAADNRKHEHWREEEKRFAVMKALLKEMVSSFGDSYIRSEILAYSATLSVGWNAPENGAFETKIRWKIKPNSISKFDIPAGESWTESSQGFSVEETSYLAYELDESKRLLPNEQEVLGYLTSRIARQVAGVEHVKTKALSPKPTKSDEAS
jgi:hypothetical protein